MKNKDMLNQLKRILRLLEEYPEMVKNYPFSKSLDELIIDIEKWVDTDIQRMEWLDYLKDKQIHKIKLLITEIAKTGLLKAKKDAIKEYTKIYNELDKEGKKILKKISKNEYIIQSELDGWRRPSYAGIEYNIYELQDNLYSELKRRITVDTEAWKK